MSFTIELESFEAGYDTKTYYFLLNDDQIVVDFRNDTDPKKLEVYRSRDDSFPSSLDKEYGEGVEARIKEIATQFNEIYTRDIEPVYDEMLNQAVKRFNS